MANNERRGNTVGQGTNAYTRTNDRSFLRISFPFAPRFGFGNGFLGSGGGPRKEQSLAGSLRLKGTSKSAESLAVELQCALLTLAFRQQNLPMRDGNR